MGSLTKELDAFVHDLRERSSGKCAQKEDAAFVLPSNFDEVVNCMSRQDAIRDSDCRGESCWSAQALADGMENDARNEAQSHWISNSTDTSQDSNYDAENELLDEKLRRELLRMELLDRKLRHSEMKVLGERWRHENELEPLRRDVESNLEEYERTYGVAPPRAVLETFTTNSGTEFDRKSSCSSLLSSSSVTQSASSNKEQIFLSVTGFDATSTDTDTGSGFSDTRTEDPNPFDERHSVECIGSTVEEASRISSFVIPSSPVRDASALRPHVLRNKQMASRFGFTSLTEREDNRLDLVMRDETSREECYGGQDNRESQLKTDEQLFSLGYWFGTVHQEDEKNVMGKSRALRVNEKRSNVLVTLQAEREFEEKKRIIDIALERLSSAPLKILGRPRKTDEKMTESENLAELYEFEINDLVVRSAAEIEEDNLEIANSKDVDQYLVALRESFIETERQGVADRDGTPTGIPSRD